MLKKKMKKMKIFLIVSIILFIIVMAILGFSRNEDILPYIPSFLRNDKLLHGLAFGILGLLLYFFWNFNSILRKWSVTALIMAFASIFSEVFQGLLPYRTIDWKDIGMNILGSLLGISTAFWIDAIKLWILKRSGWVLLDDPDLEMQRL